MGTSRVEGVLGPCGLAPRYCNAIQHPRRQARYYQVLVRVPLLSPIILELHFLPGHVVHVYYSLIFTWPEDIWRRNKC